ncbi:AAA family ATPase, partial [Rhabdothermincola sp.]|uniref:AAA family ATPase n=1 Tax=Rhabdothermincola sp. TaxID=2820405 RepID=UPI002FE00901
MTGRDPGLVGRGREQLALRELLERAVAGRASGLALEGDAGIGKTALSRWLRREAAEAGFTCLDTVGPGEARATPYAALVELLAPLRQRLDELDESGVLAGVLTGGGSATPQLVAATFLRAVAALAEHEPVLVVVDDAQWIDDASAGAIATLARRIEVDRVAVVVASREPLAWWHPTGRQSMVLEGLAEPDAVALLADAAGLTPDSARHCWRLTGGNPLALLALGPHWRGEIGDEPAALPQRLRDALDERLAAAVGAEPALLALALDRTGDESLLRDAVAGWDRMVDAGLDGGVLERLDGRLQFTHPLLRARVLDASSAAERRSVHAALADAAASADVHRQARAWHLAESVTGPDDEVAELLTQAADHYRRSGAPREALVAFRRAADLSVQPDERAARYIDAAEMAWFVGDHPLVDELLDEATDQSDAPAIRGRVAAARGQQQTWLHGPLAGYELLRREADAIERDQPALAAICLGFATFSALVAVRVHLALEVSERALELSIGSDDAFAVLGAHAARGSALILAGRAGEADAFLDPVEQLAVAAG